GTDLTCPQRVIRIDPDTHRLLIFHTLYPIGLQCFYHHILQQGDVTLDANAECFQIDDRVRHQLTGTMICNVTPTVNLMQVNLPLLTYLSRDQQILPVAALAQGVNMFMLTKEQILFSLTLLLL